MEPVIFGNKRALRLSLNKKNRRSFIIDKLRSFISVRMWENEIPKWNYESFQKMKESKILILFSTKNLSTRRQSY